MAQSIARLGRARQSRNNGTGKGMTVMRENNKNEKDCSRSKINVLSLPSALDPAFSQSVFSKIFLNL